ncbi:MAG: response regulator, partial [Algicola sp.]|nr:response regulator [Algicola sp.]
ESLVDGIAGPLPDKANKNLNMVITSGKRLANLVNDILDLSKLKHASIVLNTRSVDIHALADVVLTLSKPLVGDKDLALVNAVPTTLPVVAADEDRLLQIMHNLVGNAIKFTDSGSVRINAFVMDEHVKISITDSGIGIESDKFTAIFDAFEQVQDTTNRAYGGTGLGLSITRQLVSLHGGTIEVRSVPDEGSVFTFSLPLGAHQHQTTSAEQAIELAALPAVPASKHCVETTTYKNTFEPSLDGSRFRLLLVDDEPINLQVLNNHLSRHNYQLIEANDGLQALEMLKNNGPFDLVLLDIMMPKLSGYEVCKKIRETHSVSELPVIFLTAQNQVDNLVQGFAIGGNDHLTKPVDKHELLARVETHLKLHDINQNLEDKVEQRTREILATQKKLILSEKLASLGTLMAGVAHEINNPTNFVSVCVHTLETDLADCRAFIYQLAGEDAEQSVLDSFAAQFDPLEKHLSMLKDGSERIKTIVKDLKTSTHMNDEDKTTAAVTDIIQTTVNLIGAKYKQQIQLLTEFIDHPVISCYPAKLNQVFMNLIVNACDALLLDEGKNESHKQVIIGCRLKDSWVEITVKDNGCGMDESTKNQLFEPFFTTKGIDEGTGLGLSISYDIVQKHGGELTVESTLDIGTEFTLMLPV